MSDESRCLQCAGMGEVMGLGMIMIDCQSCDGFGSVSQEIAIKDIVKDISYVDRRSKLYKDAINDIIKLHPDITRQDAIELFDKTSMSI